MPKQSAGLLLYRRNPTESQWEVLLAHPGGPFWRKKDDGAWTIPKGEFADEEDPLAAAKREFEEETGAAPPVGNFMKLTPVRQGNRKIVHVWAIEGDFDTATLRSNTFAQEWPPKSNRLENFPEVDRAEWFPPETARQKILAGQVPLIDELMTLLVE